MAFDEAEIQALVQGESLSREDAVEILKIAAHMEAEKDAAAAKPKAKAKGKAKSKDLEPSGQSSTKRKHNRNPEGACLKPRKVHVLDGA